MALLGRAKCCPASDGFGSWSVEPADPARCSYGDTAESLRAEPQRPSRNAHVGSAGFGGQMPPQTSSAANASVHSPSTHHCWIRAVMGSDQNAWLTVTTPLASGGPPTPQP